MSSVIWYMYEFARKSWAEKFAGAKSEYEIMEKPDRFRDFPEVFKEYCIGCGACTAACPAPGAIRLIRDEDTADHDGLTYPEISVGACIRCGFCAEVCPTDPKTLTCGENHLIREEFTILPVDKMYVIDDYLCIRCKKCMKSCQVDAIIEEDNKITVDQSKCVSCGDCTDACPVKGALKAVHISNIDEQKQIIRLIVDTLEKTIENRQEEIKKLPHDKTFKMEYPLATLKEKALDIINKEDMVQDLMEKMTDRLKMRILTWDKDKCNNCRLCVNECPSGAITYKKEDGVKRDPDKCLRCSTCYQTCPFGVAGYYVAKFRIDTNVNKEDVILITLKPSQLPVVE